MIRYPTLHRRVLALTANVLTTAMLICPEAKASNEAAISTAREIAKEGLDDYDAGRYAEASDKLARALEVVRVPTLALYTARANAKLGKLVRASELYLLATRLDPKGSAEAVQLKAQRDAEHERSELLTRIPRLTVVLEGMTPNDDDRLEVTIDGQPIPKALLGTAQLVDPGARHIVARSGEQRATAAVELAEGERKEVRLRLPVNSQEAAPTQTREQPPTPPAPRHSIQPTLGWLGIGLGGAGLVVGSVAGGIMLWKRSSLQGEECAGNSCYSSAKSDVDLHNRMRNLSTVGFVAGGIFAATGITLLLTAPKSNDASSLALRFTPTGVTIGRGF